MITVANANALHIPLADQSVQCIVTSPPYWGLRDYGTAKWEGGSAECDHIEPKGTTRGGPNSTLTGGQDLTPHNGQYKDICAKCGARRIDAQIGLEATPAEYVAHIVAVMREVWRVLRDDGVLWLNLGDSYFGDSPTRRSSAEAFSEIWDKSQTRSRGGLRRSAASVDGLKPKDLCGIPWRVAFALQEDGATDIKAVHTLQRVMNALIDEYDGKLPDKVQNVWDRLSAEYREAKGNSWYLRSDIIWHKPNPMPESVTDRPTKAHEYIFLLAKQERYYYDAEAIKEPSNGWNGSKFTDERDVLTKPGLGMSERVERSGRNRRSVWTIATSPYSGAHFATFPPALVEPMILAGTSPQACEHCGAPWERVVERESVREIQEKIRPVKTAPSYNILQKQLGDKSGVSVPGNAQKSPNVNTIGWRPTCDCDNNTGSGRCLVLDPFAGSGTTGAVAVKHGRRAVLLDLNTKYIDLQFERTNGVQMVMSV